MGRKRQAAPAAADRGAPPPPARRRGRRLSALLAAVAALAVAAALTRPLWQPAGSPDLPFPDSLEGVDPEVASALEEAAAAARQAPRDGRAAGRLGQMFHAHEYYALARQSYEIAQELAPEDPRWSYHLGVMAAERGEIDAAARWLLETIRVDPSYVPAHVHLGDVLSSSGDAAAAEAAYSRALELDADNAWALGGRGRIAYESGRLEAAVEDLERSVAGGAPPRHALYQLALAYRDLGRLDESRRLMDRYTAAPRAMAMPDRRTAAIEAQARGLFGRLREARAALAAERFDVAQAIYERILRDSPREFSSLMNLANLYFRQQRFADAAELLERAVEVDPGVAHAHFGLASAYLALERFAEGERELLRVLEIEPGHPQAGRFLEQLRQMRRSPGGPGR